MDSTVAQRFFQPLLLLLAQATDKQLAGYLQYLKTENRILRSRLPKRITVTPAERTRLLKVGRPLGRAIKDLITIVSPRTFARWVSQEKKNPGKPVPAAGKGGRPRKPDEVRALILKLASEGAGSGASRIHGILTNLGVRISDATVRRILQENGIDPGPERADSTWKEFLKRHRDTLWATDFFTKNVVTKGGIVTFYVLFFIHLRSRRVHVAGMTPAPNGDWMAQQALPARPTAPSDALSVGADRAFGALHRSPGMPSLGGQASHVVRSDGPSGEQLAQPGSCLVDRRHVGEPPATSAGTRWAHLVPALRLALGRLVVCNPGHTVLCKLLLHAAHEDGAGVGLKCSAETLLFQPIQVVQQLAAQPGVFHHGRRDLRDRGMFQFWIGNAAADSLRQFGDALGPSALVCFLVQ